jgi:signal transduction histidine kinase
LFDRAGFYLARHAPDSALREPFAMHAVATLAPRLGDSVLARILAGDRGTAEVTEHIVAYAPIAPTAMADSTDTARPGWALAIEYPQNRFLAAVFNLYVLYGVLGACLLVTAMAGYLLSRRLLRPLELLQSETAQIAKGNFARRVEIKGADEIADLGRSMNAMAEQLERSYGALQDRKAFLESEVAARTAALDSERRHLAAIIDNTADAIVAFDAAGTVQLANHAAQAMLREGMVGADIAGVWPGWSDIAPMMAPKCAPESGADAPPVRRLDCAVGARRLSVVVSTLAGERGRSHILVARDVTDERRLVLERRELDRQIFLREKIATMGELAMGLAHEIGNPLAGMKAVVQALLDDETLAPRVRTYLGRFEKEVDRLAAFLRTFHGFAAPQDAQPAACHLESVLDDVLLWTRKDAQSKHIAITYQRCGAIPPLWADPNQLRQVLLNLVINAVHAVERDGHVNIRMCAPVALLHPHQGIARAKFCVEDDGPGIAADVLPRIFDPFFTTKRDGSGLGLAVVKKIAAQHGADVHVHSGPGRGTRFELVWPIAAAAAETFEAVEPLRRCAHPSDVVEVTVEETYG